MNELTTISQNKQMQVAEAPLSPAQLVEQVKLIQEVMRSVMQEGQHYGKIPGCGPKPVLLKPGAEKLQFTFRLHPEFKIEHENLEGGHKNFQVTCRMLSQAGTLQGEGVGYGSTRETKYRKASGNPADTYNTAIKMAKKRAQVDAVLTCTAASDIFTQDLEDMQGTSETLPKDNWVKNKFPASENDRGIPPSTEVLQRTSDSPAPESSLQWKGVIQGVVKHQGENAKGPWTLFRVNLDDGMTGLGDGRTATTFNEALAKDAEIMIGQEVIVLVEPNKRKPGTFTYLGFKPIELVPAAGQGELGWQEPKEEAPF